MAGAKLRRSVSGLKKPFSHLDVAPDLSSVIAVQPFRGRLSDVPGGVTRAGGNERFFADAKRIFSPVHLELFLAFNQHHDFVGIVDEVVPNPSRRIDPQVARKSACGPLYSHLCLIQRRHEMDCYAASWGRQVDRDRHDKLLVGSVAGRQLEFWLEGSEPGPEAAAPREVVFTFER